MRYGRTVAASAAIGALTPALVLVATWLPNRLPKASHAGATLPPLQKQPLGCRPEARSARLAGRPRTPRCRPPPHRAPQATADDGCATATPTRRAAAAAAAAVRAAGTPQSRVVREYCRWAAVVMQPPLKPAVVPVLHERRERRLQCHVGLGKLSSGTARFAGPGRCSRRLLYSTVLYSIERTEPLASRNGPKGLVSVQRPQRDCSVPQSRAI